METFKEYPPSQPPASFTIDPEGVVKAAKSAQQKKE
jgi:arylsulfatase